MPFQHVHPFLLSRARVPSSALCTFAARCPPGPRAVRAPRCTRPPHSRDTCSRHSPALSPRRGLSPPPPFPCPRPLAVLPPSPPPLPLHPLFSLCLVLRFLCCLFCVALVSRACRVLFVSGSRRRVRDLPCRGLRSALPRSDDPGRPPGAPAPFHPDLSRVFFPCFPRFWVFARLSFFREPRAERGARELPRRSSVVPEPPVAQRHGSSHLAASP